MSDTRPSVATSQPLILEGHVQPYAWGGYSFIPSLIGAPAPNPTPHAELWFGAHAAGSAKATLEAGSGVPLNAVIERDPAAWLGRRAPEWGNQLPFLLKILDAREMLSIQVHPSAAQARVGYDREREAPPGAHRNYADPYPKIEAHVALSPFFMLRGFRATAELAVWLRESPDIAPMRSILLRAFGAGGESGTRALFETLMHMRREDLSEIAERMAVRLAPLSLIDKSLPDYWAKRALQILDASRRRRADYGLFACYLLNLVQLQPGEGTVQQAGVLHSYLEGQTIEVMTASDNVIRAGLTAKHVDVEELLHVVRFEDDTTPILRPVVTRSARAYDIPEVGVRLTQQRFRVGDHVDLGASDGPTMVVVLEGQGMRLSFPTGARMLPCGRGAIIPANLSCRLNCLEHTAEIIVAQTAN